MSKKKGNREDELFPELSREEMRKVYKTARATGTGIASLGGGMLILNNMDKIAPKYSIPKTEKYARFWEKHGQNNKIGAGLLLTGAGLASYSHYKKKKMDKEEKK